MVRLLLRRRRDSLRRGVGAEGLLMAINNPNGRARWGMLGCVGQILVAAGLVFLTLWIVPVIAELLTRRA